MIFRNVFEEFGYTKEETAKRIDEIFKTMFYGPEDQRLYHEAGLDMAYFEDTGNNDVRTEGMSYAMMMCVQLNKQEEFNKLWKWVKTYMYLDQGPSAGYFAWSCATDGNKNAFGPAPDGEEFFAMDLILASDRWGDGDGIFNYSREALSILRAMLHNPEPMFDQDMHYIKFVTCCDYSDPSYHLPHFYELYASFIRDVASTIKLSEPELYDSLIADSLFYDNAAKASRDYFVIACDPRTGMCAEYATYDGTPYRGDDPRWGRHDCFFSDAYRTAANMGLDYEWSRAKGSKPDEREEKITASLRKFFEDKNEPDEKGPCFPVYEIDGTRVPGTEDSDFASSGRALHPYGLIATNAMSYLATNPSVKDKGEGAYVIKQFWDLPLRTGVRRYYDNCLYMFAFLALSGNYKIF
ncbi:MAG: xylanase [Lachnospiraceae bacterium]|nr:xylanase [Lachnospiraceae bacterium]